MIVAGWRDVPVDENVLGVLSKDFVPTIRQVNSIFLRDPDTYFLCTLMIELLRNLHLS